MGSSGQEPAFIDYGNVATKYGIEAAELSPDALGSPSQSPATQGASGRDTNQEGITAKDCALWYDGVFLNEVRWQPPRIVRSWAAFSGKPGISATPDNQSKQDEGPIPDSLYTVDPLETLSRATAENLWDWFKWTVKSPDWGLFVTPIRPVSQSEVVGNRKGFNIHGGRVPGSIGCIDLVEFNKPFHNWFLRLDQKLELYVRYLPLAQEVPRTHSTPHNCPDNPGLYCTQNSNCRFNRHYLGNGFTRYLQERDSELQVISLAR